ncbi:MAG TPA: MoaD/ThiS family protein [Candidatus Paceibacterota bacterium]|nr:MoaD/ThiS family protein [Candidatus Paceibacterota bacterium]
MPTGEVATLVARRVDLPQITVISGANEQTLNLPAEGSITVRDVLDRVGEFMNIPRDTQVQVNGQTASTEHTLREGDRVEFVRAAGQKA